MAIYVKEQPSWGQILGQSLGQGIGGGLSRLAEMKLQEIEQRKLGDKYEAMGLPRTLAGLPREAQGPYIKEHMRKQALASVPQFDWSQLGGGQQQGGGMLAQLGGQINPEETPWLAEQAQQMGGFQPQIAQQQPDASMIPKLLQQANQLDQAVPGSGRQFRDAAQYLEGQQKIQQRSDIAAAQLAAKKQAQESEHEFKKEEAKLKREQQAQIKKEDRLFNEKLVDKRIASSDAKTAQMSNKKFNETLDQELQYATRGKEVLGELQKLLESGNIRSKFNPLQRFGPRTADEELYDKLLAELAFYGNYSTDEQLKTLSKSMASRDMTHEAQKKALDGMANRYEYYENLGRAREQLASSNNGVLPPNAAGKIIQQIAQPKQTALEVGSYIEDADLSRAEGKKVQDEAGNIFIIQNGKPVPFRG